jgi:hypothetical protein
LSKVARAGENDFGHLGHIWLPERLELHVSGDTLYASDPGEANVTLRVYTVVKPKEQNHTQWLMARANELGISPFVREISDGQKSNANVNWGGFVVGTLLREQDGDSLDQEPETELNAVVPDTVVVEKGETVNPEELGEILPQPEGLPARQKIVMLYRDTKNRTTAMELSVHIPEGDSMELTDIQRSWRFE